jgi:hypothetical protein
LIATYRDPETESWLFKDLAGLGIIGQAKSQSDAVARGKCMAEDMLRKFPTLDQAGESHDCPEGWESAVVDLGLSTRRAGRSASDRGMQRIVGLHNHFHDLGA